MNDNRQERWLQVLQRRGYRLTAARRAVVRVLAESGHTLTPSEIYHAARRLYPALGLVSVYRTLEKLETLGLVQRVHQVEGCNTYFPNVAGHQHVLLCRRCRQARFFSGDDLDALVNKLQAETGFAIEHHWLQLVGLCERCQQEEKDENA